MYHRHRFASFTLACATLIPVVTVILYLGFFLDRQMDEILLFHVLLMLPVLAILIPVFMFLGAALWLAAARFVVPREVAERFFVYPGLGPVSAVSKWLYERAYEKDVYGS